MDKNSISAHDVMVRQLEKLSNEEFMNFGTDGLSYIKPVPGKEGFKLYSLHSANGSHIATGQDLAMLQSIAAENHLVSVALQ